MSSKYGLHKKISFIFEGGPSDTAASGGSESSFAPPLSSAPAAGPERGFVPAPAPAEPSPPDRGPAPGRFPAAFAPPVAKPARRSRKPRKKDPRQMRMRLLMAALVPVFGWVMLTIFKPPKPVKAAASPLKADSPTPSLANGPVQGQWEPPASWPGLERDPMRIVLIPAAETESAAATGESSLVVRGIVFSETNPSAIVGREIVFEGSVVQGAVVRKIHRDGVEFERDGETWTLQVRQ